MLVKSVVRRLGGRMLAMMGSFVAGLSVNSGNGGFAASPDPPAPSAASQKQQVGLPYEALDEFNRNSILDCNGNDIADDWEFVYGGEPDEDSNGLLDICESLRVGIGGVPSGRRGAGFQAPLSVYRHPAGHYLFSLHAPAGDTLHAARIDIANPTGQIRTTILESTIQQDTTIAWRPPKRWPGGPRFQRGFHDIVATVGKNTYRGTVFLESQK